MKKLHFLFERMIDLSLEELEHGLEHLERLIEELRRRHRPHHYRRPSAPKLSGVFDMSTVVLSATLPTTRKDGTPLDPSEIATITFQKASLAGSPPALGDPVVLQTNNASDPGALSFTDGSPQPGDSYTAFVTDTDGHIGDASSPFVVPATKAAPSAPGLSGSFTP